MSGIYIPDMEMPKTCFNCKFTRITPIFYAWCVLAQKSQPADEQPPEYCPLIPVPDHGRLIDADKIPDRFSEVRDLAPTVIPASESGDVK